MKLRNFLSLLLILISFTACVETTERTTVKSSSSHNAISPEFTSERTDLTNSISTIIPAEDIRIITGKTKNSGEEEYNSVTVEIRNPEEFPSNGITFANISAEVKEAVESGIANLEVYQKMKIEVLTTVEEDGVMHNRSFRKEYDL